ncbi:MAG: alpha/beta hydrolase-fold protein [Gemmatimonadota bacterium]|nr:alpha/beta hydrolase-fold protein [Gemmatimonadota bacterium]
MAGRPPVRIFVAFAAALLLLALAASEPPYFRHESQPGDYVKKMYIGGRFRDFLLHIPAGYDARRSVPLIFVFHGSSASASVIERETSFDMIADSLGFVVVYPEGLHRGWNIGECCRYSFMEHVSEVAFVKALIGRLEAGLNLDRSRIFATGYSDGGTLSMLLACSTPQLITAVASVSGTLLDPLPECNVSKPVPALIIHGTADSHIPFKGQAGVRSTAPGQHRTLSAPELTRFWVRRDRCNESPSVSRSGRVVRTEYSCPDSAEVLFYVIEGGEHGWPGGGRGWIFSPRPPADMDATDSIVRFFMRRRNQ